MSINRTFRLLYKVTIAIIVLIATIILDPLGEISNVDIVSGQGQTKLVLAFYYAWYDIGSFGPGKTPYQPITPYRSVDAGVIQQHVNQAQGAGINGFVQSWYGPSPQQTEGNFKTLLNIANASGFKAAVDFEVASPYFASNSDRISALNTLLSTHANHPAYLRVDGKPVIFFWANWILGVGDWSAIREQVDPAHNSIWIAEGANTDYLAVFDGLHLYNTAWSDGPAGTAAVWASRTREAGTVYGGYKYWVATAMPGFNDSLLGRGDATVVRDRGGGSYYQASFGGAAASSPDMVIINSFNEWAEGSNIEPSAEFGNLYLDLTSQLTAGFRAGNIAPIAVQQQATSGPSPTPSITPTAGPSPTPTNTPSPTSSPTPVASPTAQADGSIIYEVVAGDTFLGIASKFKLNVNTIYDLNNLTAESLLTIGQRLIIGYTNELGQAEQVPSFPGATIRKDGTAVYKVVEGDTPIGIAVRYGLTLEELFELNSGINAESILRIGQELIVGRLPIPEEVGGSTDRPTETAISVTETAEPTFTPTTLVEIVSPTSTPTPQASTDTSDQQGGGGKSSGSINSSLVIIFVAVVILLAATGGFFLYLGRNR